MNTLDDQNMIPDPAEVSPMKTGIRYGIIMALAGIVIQLLIYLTGGSANTGMAGGLGCLSGIISIVIMVMGIKAHRDQELGGFISIGRGMSVSLWMGLASGILSAIWAFIYSMMDSSQAEMIEEQLNEVRRQVEDGEAPEWLLGFTESMMNAGSNPITVIIGSLISAAILGFFISLFLKRDRPRDY